MSMRESIQVAVIGDLQRAGDGMAALEFRFAASQAVFAGHFPGNPILPGVFQLEMARVAAEAAAGIPLTVREMVKAKFRRPIRPDETIRVEVRLVGPPDSIQARAVLSVAGEPAGETVLHLSRTS